MVPNHSRQDHQGSELDCDLIFFFPLDPMPLVAQVLIVLTLAALQMEEERLSCLELQDEAESEITRLQVL